MLVANRSWFASLLSTRGTALNRTWPRLLIALVVSLVVTYVHEGEIADLSGLTPLPFSLVGLALGIFLGFRNNTSYDRFWEGRKLWGRMVNTSRSLTRQVLNLIRPTADGDMGAGELGLLHRELVHRIAAYVHVLRQHLRDEDVLEEVSHLMPADELEAVRRSSNRPIALLQRLGDRFRDAYDSGLLHAYHLPMLEQSLTGMTDIQGGCERIKATPIPRSYTVLIHRIVASYVFTLPFGVVGTIGPLTPVVVMLIAYAFIGLDAIGDEIEEPFGLEANDLPLSALSTMIEVNVRERVGDTDLPPLAKPVNELLS